jgi:hypothetical protein
MLRQMQLQSESSRLMREYGLEPGHIQDLPDGDGYRIAFGYLESAPGRGRWQRYFEIPVSREEFITLDESARRLILDRLAARLREHPCP